MLREGAAEALEVASRVQCTMHSGTKAQHSDILVGGFTVCYMSGIIWHDGSNVQLAFLSFFSGTC